jgi:outer membrane protein assembly factor BamB
LPGSADGPPVVAVGVATVAGLQDLVIVTTRNGDLVARNLETGAPVWSIGFGPGTCEINRSGPACYTTSSPVIDRATGSVYTYWLDGKVHKVDLGTGVEVRDAPWPVVATLKPWDEKGSSALASATVGGHTYLYVTNSGYPGDRGDYQGHVTTIDLATGASTVFNTLCSNQPVHFEPSPRMPDCGQVQSGVWARPGVTYSAATGRVYLATGNAHFDGTTDWGDSVLALHPDGTGAGGGPVDSYTPTNYAQLDTADLDLGSTLPALVEAPAGSTVAHVGVQGGKDGLLRLLNLDNLSGQGGPGHTGGEFDPVAGPGGGILTAPVVWISGAGVTWVEVATDTAVAGYELGLGPGFVPNLTQRWRVAGRATSPMFANGILYAAGNGILGAYDPTTGARLWSTPIGAIHWQSPVVVDGLVLLADASGHLTAWGP